jgi:beta-galactosidase
VLSRDAADNLHCYVENGGILLTTARSGVKDEANAVVNMPLPGLLAEVCGVEVDEYDILPADASVPLELELLGLDADAPAAHARLWCDVLTPTTAQTVARYHSGTGKPCPYYAGRAAITHNRFGQGQAMYVGTLGDEALHDAVVGWLVDVAAVSPALTTPDGVEAVVRWKDDRRLLFLLNHADHACDVVLPQQMTELLTGQMVERQVTLAPKAVMILRET